TGCCCTITGCCCTKTGVGCTMTGGGAYQTGHGEGRAQYGPTLMSTRPRGRPRGGPGRRRWPELGVTTTNSSATARIDTDAAFPIPAPRIVITRSLFPLDGATRSYRRQ